MSKAANKLRLMAAYIREHGFSEHWDEPGASEGCGCFLRAASNFPPAPPCIDILAEIIGEEYSVSGLVAHGWTRSATDDAAAACEIAADIAEAKGCP